MRNWPVKAIEKMMIRTRWTQPAIHKENRTTFLRKEIKESFQGFICPPA